MDRPSAKRRGGFRPRAVLLPTAQCLTTLAVTVLALLLGHEVGHDAEFEHALPFFSEAVEPVAFADAPYGHDPTGQFEGSQMELPATLADMP